MRGARRRSIPMSCASTDPSRTFRGYSRGVRWLGLAIVVACGPSSTEDEPVTTETTGGSTVVTDEAWEQSAWEPEPAQPESAVETWSFDEWQERLRDLAEEHGCGALATVPNLETGVGAYLEEDAPEALVEAHGALSRALREWGVECHASAGDAGVESAVGELCGQLERITSERLDAL